MMAKPLLGILGAMLTVHAHGQPTFMRNVQLPYPVTIRGSAVTPDGGLILCGDATIPGGTKGLLVRVDALGDVLWSRTYDGLGVDQGGWFGEAYEYINFEDVSNGPDGSLIVVGSVGSLDSWIGGRLIATFDAAGDTLFAKGGGGIHSSSFSAIVPEGSGNYLTGGTFNTLNTSRAFIARYDHATQSFPDGVDRGTGGWASLQDLVVGLEGGAIATGVETDFASSCILFKTDPVFVEQWYLSFSIEGSGYGRARVAEAPDSTIYLAVSCWVCQGSEPLVLVCVSPDGTPLWSRSVSLPANLDVADVQVSSNGQVFMIGTARYDAPADSTYAWLMRFNENGQLSASYRYGAPGDTVAFSTMELAADGSGYYLLGTTGDGEVLVTKVDGLGMLSDCTFPTITPVVSPIVLTPEPTWSTQVGGGGPASRFAPLGNVQYGLDQITCAGSNSNHVASGTIYHDDDQDGTLDPGESGSPWAMLSVSPNTGWLFTNEAGAYLFMPDAPGTYTITSVPLAPWWTLSSDSASYHPTFTVSDTTFEDLDFGYTAAFDTTVVVGSLTSSPVRCTGQTIQYINLLNLGSTTPQGVVALEMNRSCPS